MVVRLLLISAFLSSVACGFRALPITSDRRPSTLHRQATALLSSPPPSFGGEELQGNVATTAPPAPRVLSLKSLDEFLEYVDQAPQDSLSVIKFYSKSCPLCKRIELKYKKMAHVYQKAPIRFAEVDKAIHPDLCNTLGVDRFPFIQIYRNGQCVASHGTESDKTFGPIVNDTIQRELCMRNEEWEAFLTSFAEPIRQGAEKIQKLRDLRGQQA